MDYILTSNKTTHLARCLVGKNSAYNVTLLRKYNYKYKYKFSYDHKLINELNYTILNLL